MAAPGGVGELAFLRSRVRQLEEENRKLKAALAASKVDAAAAAATGGRTLPTVGSTRSLGSVGSAASLTRPPVHPVRSPLTDGKGEEEEDSPRRPGTAGSVDDTREAPCNNCGHTVPVRNMQNHVLHCYRHVFKCPMCDEAVEVRQKEAHVTNERGTIAQLAKVCAEDEIGLLSRMLAHGADANAELDEMKDTPLHVAARAGRLMVIQFLLSKGAVLDKPNATGETPLHVACADPKHFEVTAYLLSQGADTKARTVMGDTPLEVAQRHRNTEIALLLSRHAGGLRPGSSHGAGALRPRVKKAGSNRPKEPRPLGGRRPSMRGRRGSSGRTLRSVSPIM